MNDEEIAFQLSSEGDRRALLPLFGMILGQPAISFLVNRVVVMQIGHWRDRDSRRIHVRVTKHSIQCRRTTAAPTPDADASRIDKSPLRNRTSRSRLVAGVHDSHLAIDDLAPGTTTRRRRAAIVDAHHDITLLREHLVPQAISTTPTVHHCLSPRLAINVEQHWITFLAVEVMRLHHPAVELNAVTNIDFEKLRRSLFQLREPILRLLVIDERSCHCVLRQGHDLSHRNLVEGGIEMNREVAARRDVVTMHTRNVRGRQSFFLARAVDAYTIEITLRRIVR